VRLLAGAIVVLALAIFGGSVVIAQAIEQPETEIEVIQRVCQEGKPGVDEFEVATCILSTVDSSP
jgi:hypothetical protein